MKVLKEKPVPKDTVICKNCGSVLEYTNGDLYEDFNQPNFSISSLGHTFKNYHVHCPICGCDTPASWVNRKEADRKRGKKFKRKQQEQMPSEARRLRWY